MVVDEPREPSFADPGRSQAARPPAMAAASGRQPVRHRRLPGRAVQPAGAGGPARAEPRARDRLRHRGPGDRRRRADRLAREPRRACALVLLAAPLAPVPGRPVGALHVPRAGRAVLSLMEDADGLGGWLSLRCRALPVDGGSHTRGQLSLLDVPALVGRRVHDLRPLSHRRLRVGAAGSRRAIARRPRPSAAFAHAAAARSPCMRRCCRIGCRLRSAASTGPEDVRPDDHVWTERQLPWLEIVDDLPEAPHDQRRRAVAGARCTGEAGWSR